MQRMQSIAIYSMSLSFLYLLPYNYIFAIPDQQMFRYPQELQLTKTKKTVFDKGFAFLESIMKYSLKNHLEILWVLHNSYYCQHVMQTRYIIRDAIMTFIVLTMQSKQLLPRAINWKRFKWWEPLIVIVIIYCLLSFYSRINCHSTIYLYCHACN